MVDEGCWDAGLVSALIGTKGPTGGSVDELEIGGVYAPGDETDCPASFGVRRGLEIEDEVPKPDAVPVILPGAGVGLTHQLMPSLESVRKADSGGMASFDEEVKAEMDDEVVGFEPKFAGGTGGPELEVGLGSLTTPP